MSEEEQKALLEAVRMLQEQNAKLAAALKPFGEAYILHAKYANQPRKFKERITLSLGMMDWDGVVKALGLQVPTPEDEKVKELL